MKLLAFIRGFVRYREPFAPHYTDIRLLVAYQKGTRLARRVGLR